jgi:alpha-ketoglutaric semialdehyde dehydrogenase
VSPLLILVDLQRDYLAAPGLEPPAPAVVRQATRVLDGCRAAGLDIVHVWTTVRREPDQRMPHWKRDGRWICVEGTPGHAPPPGLEPEPGEAIVHKTHFNPFTGTELEDEIRERGADRVVVCGLHLHACVRETVIGAYERGLEVWVADEATGSDDPVHAAITRRYLERRAARFLSTDDLLAAPAPSATPKGATSRVDVGEIARAAAAAQPDWALRASESRLEVLARVATALEDQADELAELMAEEIGKPVRFGAPEVHRTGEMLGAVAAHAEGLASDELHAAAVHRRPVGAIAIVTPWNNPVYIPLGKIAPALAYGNAVLWKPAPAAQPIAERVASLLRGAGLPADLLGIVPGARAEAEALMADPSIDAVSITGSTAAGYSAQEACARRRIPLQAELGGNNAALVWSDADLELAAKEIADGAFAQAGQRCTANRRVVVHTSCADRLLDLLRERTAELAWGDPHDPEVSIGPIVDERAHARIAAAVDAAAADAAGIEVPHGSQVPSNGAPPAAWYPATLIRCEDPGAEIVQEETFGPVLVVQRATDWDQAMSLVSGVSQGLAAAVFTSSPDLAQRFQREAATGIVKVNRSTADAEVDVPFGGWKASGIGPPEHGSFDRDFYTRPQVVYG